MISVINQRSDTHNCCEDSYFVKEVDETISGGVFDGCSTGIKSHWASQTLSYIFQLETDGVTTKKSVFNAFLKMYEISKSLQLTNFNFLSTCVLFDYDKVTKQLDVLVLGDGYYFINGVEYEVDQNNEPDYLGHVLTDPKNIFEYVEKYKTITYTEVTDFKICSDGIKAINKSQYHENKFNELTMLLGPIYSENYLTRQWNILKKNHYSLSDDLTIISYVQD
jgi:hypothetical protein